MTVCEILKMGDPRLLRQAEQVTAFDTAELDTLVADMFETMHAVNGAGLVAPQIGVNLQLVIFGFSNNVRYPDARVVQHECDHLNGILYPMRIKDFTRFGYTEILFSELDPNHDD